MPFQKNYIPWNKGKRLTEEHKQKDSEGLKLAYKTGKRFCWFIGKPELHPRWKGGKPNTVCKDCGKTCYYKADYCRSCSLNHKLSGYHTMAIAGNKNRQWKGDKISYSPLHSWVRRWLGKAWECVYCGKNKLETRIGWASISHRAKRDLNDYISLCTACHSEYDKKVRIQI